MSQRPPDQSARPESRLVVRSRLSAMALEAIRAQLARGWVFLAMDMPSPPGTPVAFVLENDKGHIAHSGEGTVVAWHTLIEEQFDGQPAGMRVKLSQLDGQAVDLATAEEITSLDLRDASEALVDQIDLDADAEPSEPVELPEPGPTAAPIGFKDASSEVDVDIDVDLDDLAVDDPPAEPRPRPAGRAQRRDTRATVALPVKVRQLPVGASFEAKAWNLSAGGLFLRTSEKLPVMGLVDLELALPDMDAPIHLAAKVVRVQPPSEHSESPRMAGLGVRFIDPPDDLRQRIVNFVLGCRVRARELAVQRIAALAEQGETDGGAEEPAGESQPAARAVQVATAPARAMLPPAEQKKLVVNSLVAALELTGVDDFQDNETLRYLLEIWYREYHHDGTVDLTLLWNTLAADDSLDSIQSALPLFIFGLARQEHGLGVVLPEGLSHFDGYGQTVEIARQTLSRPGAFRAAYDRVAARAAQAVKARRAGRAAAGARSPEDET